MTNKNDHQKAEAESDEDTRTPDEVPERDSKDEAASTPKVIAKMPKQTTSKPSH